ncbi:hypothetical protein DFJ58DRAFT_832884 [Suillus subalutaceus]|uniref:uncharacterized protein n=1 Tax=Suillus subalutaceus TaxID=48586 RepID=UPI001B862F88|nr:uncharacterized protein DFJ58DRAFT_832884 [Suillus subalutaceus]KAG1819393.1 hypothetical protein DFJ58DRAFT_832884 [Suillus subalutaceus]
MQQLPATITPRAKGKQLERSLGLHLGFFDQPPHPSSTAKGRPIRLGPGPSSGSVHQQASTRFKNHRSGTAHATSSKIIETDSSSKSKSNVREAQQTSSRSASRELAYSTSWQLLDPHSSPSIPQGGVDSIHCRGLATGQAHRARSAYSFSMTCLRKFPEDCSFTFMSDNNF